MTDGEGAFQPGRGEPNPRSSFVAHEVFGHGTGAVLVAPDVARDLRSAAEFASQERRITGGLLYGHGWVDDDGPYLVVDEFIEAGPGENHGDRISRDGRDSFRLSPADLGLLREDAARMNPDAVEVGWWRSLEGPGEFGRRDFEAQSELVRPGGVGLLVFGAGLDWGTAYLGPDGLVPGSARSFIPVPRPAAEAPQAPTLVLGPVIDPEPEPDADPVFEPEPEPVSAAAPGTSLESRRQPVLTPAPQPTGPRVVSPVRVPSREWGVKPATPGGVEPRWPTDVKLVVGALIVVAIVAAIIVGMLVSSALIAVIVGVVCLLALSGFLWMSRL
ncbi:MAG TPA: hypothetical protein VGG83_23695 [Trebonia sp.]|jgi:hypothetical protein